MHEGSLEGADGDGVEADDLVLRVEQDDHEVLAVRPLEELPDHLRGDRRLAHLLSLGRLAVIPDELNAAERDAVHGCLLPSRMPVKDDSCTRILLPFWARRSETTPEA
jgi:hypothetical protein